MWFKSKKPRYVWIIKKRHAKYAKFMDSENLTLMVLDALVCLQFGLVNLGRIYKLFL